MGVSALIRLALAIGIVASAVLAWGQLTRYATWAPLDGMVNEAYAGRLTGQDVERLQGLFETGAVADCRVLRGGALTFLHLYAIDTGARAIGAHPLLPSDDPQLTAMRGRAQDQLIRALACTPLDGDLWLSLAVVSRALGQAPDLTARYLALSVRYAPHEGWIAERRNRLF